VSEYLFKIQMDIFRSSGNDNCINISIVSVMMVFDRKWNCNDVFWIQNGTTYSDSSFITHIQFVSPLQGTKSKIN